MNIPPSYKITPEILGIVAKIEANLIYLSSLNVSSLIKENIQRKSILKSSLFSARIEGNPLTLDEVNRESNGSLINKEIFNISKAAEFINKKIKARTKITKEIILNLHLAVMKNLSSDAGKFRHEVSAIFNQAGVAVYVTPPPNQIQALLDKMLEFVNSDAEKFPLINAFVSHVVFEKIHPFIDGNGRVGRLLINSILRARYNIYNFSVPFEEYLDGHKGEYYHYLDSGMSKTEDYLLFMLETFYEQTEKLKEDFNRELNKKETLFLPPRQEEIFNIIKDQNIVSFDTVRRRFLKVPERTLRYDLKKLLDKELIIKIGTTKGVYYKIKP